MPKERITITLAPSVLAKLDQLIDKKTIRNRSHAIEHILSQAILSSVTKVVILAAGKGINMRPLTYELPKAMLPVKNKPLVAHTIESLAKTGLKDITFVTGHLGSKIQEYFADGQKFGVNIQYIQDESESGTAQALKSVEHAVGSSPFLLIYGDVLADIDWVRFIDFHDSNEQCVTMAVTTSTETRSWGMVRMEGSKIVDFKEKAQSNESSHMINSGIYVVDPQMMQRITPQMRSFEEEVLPLLAMDGKLFGYHFSGKWIDVGSPADYERALKTS